MSGSDAEFEKFLQEDLPYSASYLPTSGIALQYPAGEMDTSSALLPPDTASDPESLSSSAASYLSELSRSGAGGTNPRSLQPWWTEGSTSDQEIEAAGQSWLKSSSAAAHSGTARGLTLPTVPEDRRVQDTSVDQSRDSLEEGNAAVSKDSHKYSAKASFKSSGKSSGKNFTKSKNTGVLEHSGHFSQAGPNTLEEDLDKQHFFVELEQDRASPIDYSELNRQLGDTGLSSLSTGSVGDQDSLQGALKLAIEDQELTPKQSDDIDESYHAEQEVGPTAGSFQAKECLPSISGFDLSPIHKPMPCTHRVRPSESGFMLSPIHKSGDLTTSGASAKPTFVPHQLHKTGLSPLHVQNTSRDLNTSGASSKSDSTSHLSESFTLSPIPTGLEARAGGQFKSSIKPLARLPSPTVQQPQDTSLSPIYAKQSQTSKTRKKPENQTKHIKEPESLTLSPIHALEGTGQHENSTGDHQQQTIYMPSAEIPSSLSFISSGTHTDSGTHDDHEFRMSEGDKKLPDIFSQVEENNSKQVLAVDQEQVSNSDMNTDLAELQSALKAAGMTKLSQFESTTTKFQSPDDHEISSPSAVKGPGSSSVHAEDSHIRGLQIEQTIRAIATEELASLTKEIILQDMETGAKNESPTTHLDTPHSHTSSDTLPTIHGDDLTEEQLSAKPTSSELNEGLSKSSLKKSVPETQKSVSSKSQKQSRRSVQSPAVFEQVKSKQQFAIGKKSSTQSVKRKLVPSSHPPNRSKIASSSLRHPGLKSPCSAKTVPSTVQSKSLSRGSFRKSRSLTTTGDVDSTENAGSSKKGTSFQESELFSGYLQSKNASVILKPPPECVQQTSQEVSKWQKAWQEQKLEAKERELSQLEERLRVKHDKEQQELRQEIFALNIKLCDLESSRDPRHQAVSGQPIPEQERATLQKDIQEQEALLQGYQKENERLYNAVTESQKELKAVKAQMYKENQKLATELVNAKSQLELQAHHPPQGEAVLAAARATQLEGELQQSQHVCRGLEEQVRQLQQVKQHLEQDAESLRRANHMAEVKQADAVSKQELQQIKDKHKEEVSGLMQQLKWYAENQKLLDQDSALLTCKEKEIADLKERLASLELSETKQRIARSRAAGAKKIRELEQQVKELEGVIQRRFPNSLSALILASAAAESGNSGAEDGAAKGRVRTEAAAPSTHLERRVHQLEKQLETKDQESARRMRALQQKYTAMELLYEQQLSTLKEQLQHVVADAGNTSQQGGVSVTTAHPHTTVLALERELASVRQKQQAQISQLEREVERLREDNRKLKHTQESSWSDVGKKKLSLMEGSELLESKTQVADHPGSSEPQAQDKERGTQDQDQGQGYTTVEWQSRELEAAALENHQLREQLSKLQFELVHQRVQLQGKLAQAEGNTRQIQEDMHEKLASLQLKHRHKVDELVGRFTREHSQSEVTRLQSKLAALEATVAHLRGLLQTSHLDSEMLLASKSREKQLTQQVQSLSQELVEARKHQTPEMHHFSLLQAKISNLETRTLEYESRMKEYWHLLQNPSKEKLKEMKHRWQKQMQTKNAEIECFREELDSILSTLQVLEQGTVALQ